ncbi:hypothetical protein M8C21_007953, partial [Ambrosia artemisiifolia]
MDCKVCPVTGDPWLMMGSSGSSGGAFSHESEHDLAAMVLGVPCVLLITNSKNWQHQRPNNHSIGPTEKKTVEEIDQEETWFKKSVKGKLEVF